MCIFLILLNYPFECRNCAWGFYISCKDKNHFMKVYARYVPWLAHVSEWKCAKTASGGVKPVCMWRNNKINTWSAFIIERGDTKKVAIISLLLLFQTTRRYSCTKPFRRRSACPPIRVRNIRVIISRIMISYCSVCRVGNCLTLSRREPTSTRKQPGKGHVDYLLAICQESARARASVLFFLVCERASERASVRCVRVFTGRTSERRRRSLTRTSTLLTGNNLQ